MTVGVMQVLNNSSRNPIQNFKYVLGMSKVFPRFVASDTSMF